MLVETVLSMLTVACHLKHGSTARGTPSKLAWLTVALFNILVQWDGLTPADDGSIPLAIAQFSL